MAQRPVVMNTREAPAMVTMNGVKSRVYARVD